MCFLNGRGKELVFVRRNRHTVLFVLLFLALTLATLLSPLYLPSDGLTAFREPTVAIQAKNCYQDTLSVVADIDYQPYTFLDQNGNYTGHDVELVNELANRLEMNLNLKLIPWSEALESVASGKSDMILGTELVYGETARNGIVMSVPIVSDPFVAFGREKADNISVLYGKKLAIINGSGANFIIQSYQLDPYCISYPTYTEAFASVASGENDYVIIRYSVGRFIRKKIQATNVDATGLVLIDNNLCFGINENEPELQTRINDTLVEMIADGTLAKLQDKWLGNYVKVQSLMEYLQLNIWIVILYAAGLVLLLSISLFAYARRSRKTQQRLVQLAELDSLTGLLNRASLEAQIQLYLDKRNYNQYQALFIIDIDRFKDINDRLGHKQGDEALQSLAVCLKAAFRDDDVVGRLGGDEFAVLMQNIPEPALANHKAKQLCALAQRLHLSSCQDVSLSISIGIALSPQHGTNFDQLYEHADAALYLSKKRGRGTYTVYDGRSTSFLKKGGL